jgi:hypothetical protein
MSNYKWEVNQACVSTYKILEGDDFLDQFEESDWSFDDAKDLRMEQLRYYPKTTANPDIIKLVSYEIARKFIKYVVKHYSVKKEKKETTSEEIITKVASIFAYKDKTVGDLAEAVDNLVKFSDEE